MSSEAKSAAVFFGVVAMILGVITAILGIFTVSCGMSVGSLMITLLTGMFVAWTLTAGIISILALGNSLS